MNPKVSVIIPTYNRAKQVRYAVWSVLEQAYRDFELIVVDDCSEDNTEEVVKRFKDTRVKYIRLGENSGSSTEPRNIGIRESKGEYVAFLDSDDCWFTDKLEKQVKVLEENPEVGLVYCGLHVADKKYKRYWIPLPPEKDFLPGMLPSTVLLRKSYMDRIGEFDTLPGFSDTEYFYRLLNICKPYLIDEALVLRQTSPDSFGASSTGHAEGLRILFEKHHGSLKDNGYIYVALGNAYLLAGKPRRKYFLQAIAKSKFSLVSVWSLAALVASYFGLRFYRSLLSIYKYSTRRT